MVASLPEVDTMCSLELDDSDTVLAPDWETVEDGLVPPAGRKGDQSDVDRRLVSCLRNNLNK